jgi:hypothetical protein
LSEQQESAHHELMGGALHVYKRVDSKFWQCATFLNGFNHRSSTKEKGLAQAKDIAKDWYLTLQGKLLKGELLQEYARRSPSVQTAPQTEANRCIRRSER